MRFGHVAASGAHGCERHNRVSHLRRAVADRGDSLEHFQRQVGRFDEGVALMVWGQPRQGADIHGDSSQRTGRTGHGERLAFYTADGYRDGGCTAADAATRNAKRQDHIKRRTGRGHRLDLIFSNLLQ